MDDRRADRLGQVGRVERGAPFGLSGGEADLRRSAKILLGYASCTRSSSRAKTLIPDKAATHLIVHHEPDRAAGVEVRQRLHVPAELSRRLNQAHAQAFGDDTLTGPCRIAVALDRHDGVTNPAAVHVAAGNLQRAREAEADLGGQRRAPDRVRTGLTASS